MCINGWCCVWIRQVNIPITGWRPGWQWLCLEWGKDWLLSTNSPPGTAHVWDLHEEKPSRPFVSRNSLKGSGNGHILHYVAECKSHPVSFLLMHDYWNVPGRYFESGVLGLSSECSVIAAVPLPPLPWSRVAEAGLVEILLEEWLLRPLQTLASIRPMAELYRLKRKIMDSPFRRETSLRF